MELSKQLIENINNLSDDDKKLLIDLIKKMTKKEEHSNISIFEKNNSTIKISKATKFPIHNTLLKEESDYIKGLYFQCLAVALTYIKDNKEDPLYLFNRLLAGAEIDGDTEFYLKKAYSLEKEQLYNFLEEIKLKNLKYRFIIDFIVLLGSNNLEKENLTIIAEFCEALEIEKNDVKLLFNIANSILTQNINLYWELTNQNNNYIKSNIANDYMTFDKTKTEEIYKKASNLFRMFKFKEALPLLQQLAVSGYPEAYALLYWIYCDDEKYKSKKLQFECLKKGYELKDTVTTMLYGIFCTKEDYFLARQTLPKIEKLAKEGNVFAEYTLGIAAINNIFGEQDFYLAVKHFIKAHGMGFYRASWSILLRYKNGEGVFTKDWIHASLWAEETLKWGIEYKGFNIALMYMTIDEYGCNDANIQNDFYKKAISLWKRLIDLGDARAATNLGWMYTNGKGVEKSDIEAFKYYKKSADMGYNIGQYNLAIYYENGKGTEKDINKAIFWYKKSAEQGYQDAKDALERLGVRY